MAQARPSIQDRLDEGDADIDSSLRRKLRKINAKFFDVPDKLIVGSEGRVRRAPKEAETKVKEEIKDCQGLKQEKTKGVGWCNAAVVSVWCGFGVWASGGVYWGCLGWKCDLVVWGVG
jgi:hypothetical protein